MKHWWQPEAPASYQEKAFYEFFYDTVTAMESQGIIVLDMMPGVAVMLRNKKHRAKVKAIISISWMGSWKKSLFVLLHEVGHLASAKPFKDGVKLVVRKSPSSEKAANTTACKLLVGFGFEDVVPSYVRMYNELNKEAIKVGLRKPFKGEERV